MHTYPFFQVDAFTTEPLAGNPCAIILDADDLDETAMLAIAREMNLSETSFVMRSNIADFRARYFTPAEEIPLAGHPTVATAFALAETGRLALKGERTSIRLELQIGPIQVEIFSEREKIKQIVMTQKKPQFLSKHDPSVILPIFGLRLEDLMPGLPIQTVSTGTPQMMVPLTGHDALRRARLDIEAYRKYRAHSDFFSPHLFCLGGFTRHGNTSARHFGVPPDTMEDPFTGSATGGMASYMWRYEMLKESSFIAEQGHWMNRPGNGYVEVVGPRDNIETVKVGGSAVTVFRGELIL